MANELPIRTEAAMVEERGRQFWPTFEEGELFFNVRNLVGADFLTSKGERMDPTCSDSLKDRPVA